MLEFLSLLACFLSGSRAGIDIDGFIVRFPAWRQLGAEVWAVYSRKADLGNGIFLYPALAVGHALLVVAIVFGLHYRGPTAALPAAYVALALAIFGLLLTVRAAPIMLSLKRSGDNPVVLRDAFRKFARLSLFRTVAQVLAFIATLQLLARVST